MPENLRFTNNRDSFYDLLRVMGAVAVMILHISSQHWRDVPVVSFEWSLFNTLNGCVRWGVPVFAMISGCLFLGRDIPFNVLLKKYIFRIAAAIVFWSVIYVVFSAWRGHSAEELKKEFLLGHYHMWYLYMLIGLYLLVPFLRVICRDEKLMRLFLFLGLITVLPSHVLSVTELFGRLKNLRLLYNQFKFTFFNGYAFYFVLGYYLKNHSFPFRISCMMGLAGFVLTPLLSWLISVKLGSGTMVFYQNLSLNVILQSVFMFELAKRLAPKLDSNCCKKNAAIRTLAKMSFGVYLVHPLIIEELNHLTGFNTLSFNTLFTVPLMMLLVAGISLVITFLLSLVPVLNKYVV